MFVFDIDIISARDRYARRAPANPFSHDKDIRLTVSLKKSLMAGASLCRISARI
jgi:hypothetical protein